MKKIIAILLTFVMCAALAACGGKKEDNGSDVPEAQQSEQTNPGGNVELAERSDDTHYVVFLDPAYHVFVHDGETITGYYSYIKYDDALSAEATYQAFEEQYKKEPENWPGVDHPEIIGTTFVIFYSDDYFGGSPLSSIEGSYSEYKVD